MSKPHSPPDCYTENSRGRPQLYTYRINTAITREQKEFIDSECAKMGVGYSEYIRTIIQDLMEENP